MVNRAVTTLPQARKSSYEPSFTRRAVTTIPSSRSVVDMPSVGEYLIINPPRKSVNFVVRKYYKSSWVERNIVLNFLRRPKIFCTSNSHAFY